MPSPSQPALISSLHLLLQLLPLIGQRETANSYLIPPTNSPQNKMMVMVTLLFYYPAVRCTRPSYNWDTKKENCPSLHHSINRRAGCFLRCNIRIPSEVHQLQKQAVHPMGHLRSPPLFSPMQSWLSKPQTERQWEGSPPMSGSLKWRNTSEYANIIAA